MVSFFKKNSSETLSRKKSVKHSKFNLCFGFKLLSMDKKVAKENLLDENQADVKPRRSQRKRNPVLSSCISDLYNISEVKDNEPSTDCDKPAKKSRKKVATKVTTKKRQRKINFCCVANQSSSSPDCYVAAKSKYSLPEIVTSESTEKTSSTESKDKPSIQQEEGKIFSIENELEKQPLESPEKNCSEQLSPLPEIIRDHLHPPALPNLASEENDNETVVINDNLRYLITDQTPPESYWKSLLDRRVEALEAAQIENAKLLDRISVAATENKHLRSVVHAGTELIDDFKEYLRRFVDNIDDDNAE